LWFEVNNIVVKAKGKTVPVQAWTGPETAHEGGKVVSLAHRPPLSPGNIPGTHFC